MSSLFKMAPVLRMDGFLREADDGINNKFNQLKSPEKFRNARNTQTGILHGIDRSPSKMTYVSNGIRVK